MSAQANPLLPSETEVYSATHKIRFVTAASLFDGHDASINVMRRILQASGVEVIHLGHNRSVAEVIQAAIQEDVQGIAISSYQGGHVEYFKYAYDLLQQQTAGHIRIFGGGGGVIVPSEIEDLEAHGIDKIFSPEDGRRMGLQGMINLMIKTCDFDTTKRGGAPTTDLLSQGNHGAVARAITLVEQGTDTPALPTRSKPRAPVLGITGTGGAGKSSLTDELILRYRRDFPTHSIAILATDPTRRRTGGALLGDRIRMNAIDANQVYMRSLATRGARTGITGALDQAMAICQAAGFDLIIAETSGIGQGDGAIVDHVDRSLYVMTSEFGAATQLEKIEMLDYANMVALNKFDKRAALDSLRAVRKQWRRNRSIPYDTPDEQLPVFGTVASHWGNKGVDALYVAILDALGEATGRTLQSTLRPDIGTLPPIAPERHPMIAPSASATSQTSPRPSAATTSTPTSKVLSCVSSSTCTRPKRRSQTQTRTQARWTL